jgi:hypothetical protein
MSAMDVPLSGESGVQMPMKGIDRDFEQLPLFRAHSEVLNMGSSLSFGLRAS